MSHVVLPRRRAHPGGPQGLRRGGRAGTRSRCGRLRRALRLRRWELARTGSKFAVRHQPSSASTLERFLKILHHHPETRFLACGGRGRLSRTARAGSVHPSRGPAGGPAGRQPGSPAESGRQPARTRACGPAGCRFPGPRTPMPARSRRGRAAPSTAGARPGRWPARPPAGSTAAPATSPHLRTHIRAIAEPGRRPDIRPGPDWSSR